MIIMRSEHVYCLYNCSDLDAWQQQMNTLMRSRYMNKEDVCKHGNGELRSGNQFSHGYWFLYSLCM